MVVYGGIIKVLMKDGCIFGIFWGWPVLGHDKIWEWQEGSDTLYIGSVKKTFKFILSVTKSPVFQRAKQTSPFKCAF